MTCVVIVVKRNSLYETHFLRIIIFRHLECPCWKLKVVIVQCRIAYDLKTVRSGDAERSYRATPNLLYLIQSLHKNCNIKKHFHWLLLTNVFSDNLTTFCDKYFASQFIMAVLFVLPFLLWDKHDIVQNINEKPKNKRKCNNEYLYKRILMLLYSSVMRGHCLKTIETEFSLLPIPESKSVYKSQNEYVNTMFYYGFDNFDQVYER